MRSAAQLVVGPLPPGRSGYRVERMAGQAPLAWRATPEAVYMIGTSASPVGDDQVEVAVHARTGAHLAVRTTAAAIAWSGTGSLHSYEVTVDDGASLDWAPEPLVATARCSHEQRSVVRLAGDARLRWREMLVFGRVDESPGLLTSRLSVLLDGRPLLRHELSTAPDPALWDGPAVLGGARVAGMLVLVGGGTVGGGTAGIRQAAGEGWAVMPLEASGFLALAVGPDAVTTSSRLRRAGEAIPPAPAGCT